MLRHKTPQTSSPSPSSHSSTNFFFFYLFSFFFLPFLHNKGRHDFFLHPRKKTHTHTPHTHTHTPHIHTHMNTCARNEKGKTKRNPMPGLGNEEMGVKENREKVEGGR
jgi:hypothetical protein